MLPAVPVLSGRNASGGRVCLFGDSGSASAAGAGSALEARLGLTAQCALAVTVVLANVYTMAAIWPRRHRRSTQSSLFVLHLALADTLCGLAKLVVMIFSANCHLATLASTCETACLSPVVFSLFTWTLSATTLAAIAVDRYVCVVHSLRYYEFMNTRRVLGILSSLWVVSAICATLYLPTWDWEEGRYCEEQILVPLWHLLAVQIPLSALVLFVVAATHIVIRGEVQRNDARWRAAGNCGASSASTAALWPSRLSSASVRSAKIAILVVVSFVMCYLPVQVFQVLIAVDRTSVNPWHFFLIDLCSSLWYLLNPFIYAWKNAAIREDMCALWRRIVTALPFAPSRQGRLEKPKQASGGLRF